jgi:mono/diheme cytochrome c family protein
MMKVINIGLAVALVATLVLNVALRSGARTQPGFEYFPDMARTVRYNAFESNPNFPDGMTLRVPPAGTVPRGLLPISAMTPADGVLANPFAATDPGVLDRGKVVFDTYCVPCHGPAGQADGLVVQHGFPAPPTLLRARTRAMPDAQIFNIITNGTGSMPYYSAQIAREDRWKAVLYVRKLQSEPPPPPAGDAK